jgi:hypothetical protein
MSESLTKLIIDASTGESHQQELSSEEIAELAELAKESAFVQSLEIAKAQARTSALAKLAALGLTEEEIAAL